MTGYSNNNNNNINNRNHHGYRQNFYNNPQQSQGQQHGAAAAAVGEAVDANSMIDDNSAPKPMSSLAAAALRGRTPHGSSQVAKSGANAGFASAAPPIKNKNEFQNRETKGQVVNRGANSDVAAAADFRKNNDIQKREVKTQVVNRGANYIKRGANFTIGSAADLRNQGEIQDREVKSQVIKMGANFTIGSTTDLTKEDEIHDEMIKSQVVNRGPNFNVAAAPAVSAADVRKNDEIQDNKAHAQPVKSGPVSSLAAAAAAGRRKGQGIEGQATKNKTSSNFSADGRNNGKSWGTQMVHNGPPPNGNDGSWNNREYAGQRKNGTPYRGNAAGANYIEAQSQTTNNGAPNVGSWGRQSGEARGKFATNGAPPNIRASRNGQFSNVPVNNQTNDDAQSQVWINSGAIGGSGNTIGGGETITNDSQSMSTATGTSNKNKNRNRNRNRNRKKKAQAAQATQAVVVEMEKVGDQVPPDINLEAKGGWCSSSVATSITNGTAGRYKKRNRNRKKKANAPGDQQNQFKGNQGRPVGNNVGGMQIKDGASVGTSSNMNSGKWNNRNRNNKKNGQNQSVVGN